MSKSFRERVLQIVRRIPSGRVMTYKAVAQAAGSPRAYRAVGAVLSTNFDARIPCHRVICSDGSLGGYNRGQRQKRKLLEQEGVGPAGFEPATNRV